MRVVLDTSALLCLSDFSIFEEIFIPESVLKEIKSETLKIKFNAINAKIVRINKKIRKEILEIAKKSGDKEKLSDADLDVLALAKEKNCAIVSDDYSIQNVAKFAGIKFFPIFNKPIKKLIKWRKFCKICKKFYKIDKTICEICGNKLSKIPLTKNKLNRKL